MPRFIINLIISLALLSLAACDNHPWNDPYSETDSKANIRYSSFSASPKTLDPARSYSSDEIIFIAQIYEPPLQYHYLKRPYTLIPLTAAHMPKVFYLDQAGQKLPAASSQVAFTVYEMEIKPGIYYQPHPAFAKNQQEAFVYQQKAQDHQSVAGKEAFIFAQRRELIADDYVYQIKRLAAPGINSPIFGIMSSKIVGLSDFALLLQKNKPLNNKWLDLRKYPLVGAKAIDRYRYQIIIKGVYPQFMYWLAMPFFAPIPWEVDAFYAQPGMREKNISFDWFPVGTGPYMLIENNPNRRMTLVRNPLFHPEFFPVEGEPGDKSLGYLNQAGKKLPFINQVVFTLEKESIPRWNKFLQGYYDQSTISSDSFDQAIQIDSSGLPILTPSLKKMGVYLQTTVMQAMSYMGFNMRDDVVGGNSERARKLRLAISLAVDFEEYINIFLNGRGLPAQGPIPPGIFGYETGAPGINNYLFTWKNNKPTRRPIEVAKRLMSEAGYANGIDPVTGEPLILNYDVATTSGPDEKALLAWMREQFAKLGIQLNIRNTEYNRFQEIIRLGKGQIFMWGWIADYPDPENFLFLLYGPNSKALYGGENAANYYNKEFDALFDHMKNMPNSNARQQIINKMLEIIRHDAPWVWGVYQEEFILNHVWDYPSKPNVMSYNALKYQKINPVLRDKLRHEWNKKVLWPIGVLVLIFLIVSLPVFIRYTQKERKSVK
ncbi:MAG: ABC transporter substrate-binding protein [Gammaproteobacteria bacterium]|nr:ABC transporter substrate-binding protein [Gammaproteobacteria bacterium]